MLQIGTKEDQMGDILFGFSHYNRSWFRMDNHNWKDEVMLRLYKSDGSVVGEMAMRWYVVEGKLSARLEVYHDAWHVLPRIGKLIEKLATLHKKGIDPEEFCELLKECGFEDLTLTKKPDLRRIENALSNNPYNQG